MELLDSSKTNRLRSSEHWNAGEIESSFRAGRWSVLKMGLHLILSPDTSFVQIASGGMLGCSFMDVLRVQA